jgi:predicted membrane chloride channel (bestrophin family)
LLFAVDLLQADLVNPLVGLPRFLLTPVPFRTEPAYAFLDAAAALHWLLLPFVFVGLAAVIARPTPFSRVLVAYLAVFTTLYAVYGELQGPRHRVQLDFAFALLQFIGVWHFAIRERLTVVPAARPARVTAG